MKQIFNKIIWGVVGVAVCCVSATTPALASEASVQNNSDALIPVSIEASKNAETVTTPALTPELITNKHVEPSEKIKNQPALRQVIDLRIVKVQIKQGNLKNSQFVVLKNYGSPVNLGDFSLQMTVGDSPVIKREVELGPLQFDKTQTQLAPGEMLILVNNLELAKHFLNLQTNLIQCLSDCQSAEPWLEPAKSKQKYQLRLVHRPTNQVAHQFNYLKNSSTAPADYHQFADYDFLSLVTINGQESDVWQGFSAVHYDPIWLKAEQLPPLTPPELKCKSSEELVNGQCLKKCPKNYSRDLATGQCRRDPCPAGKILDQATDSCVTDQTSCKPGYAFNPDTKRCAKIKTTEPKTCPAGYVLNSATNRCNKIVLAVAKPPCPDGQLRHPETGRCRKIVLEADCTKNQELINGKCLKRCTAGQVRDPLTGRCQKVEQACQAGFTKDRATGICVKNVIKKSATGSKSTNSDKINFGFDWLKMLNSPVSGAIVASAIFVVYDKFFRAKN